MENFGISKTRCNQIVTVIIFSLNTESPMALMLQKCLWLITVGIEPDLISVLLCDTSELQN